MIAKRKTIIFLIVTGIVISFLIIFLLHSQLKEIKRISQELIRLKKELILFQDKIGELEKFKGNYQKLEPNFKKIDSLFTDPEIPIDLIKFWEKSAYEAGLLIEISPVFIKPVETDPWEPIGFQLVLTGSPQNFLKFLEKTEIGPYLNEVQSLVITRQEKEAEAEGGGVKATLLVKVFAK